MRDAWIQTHDPLLTNPTLSHGVTQYTIRQIIARKNHRNNALLQNHTNMCTNIYPHRQELLNRPNISLDVLHNFLQCQCNV